MLTNALGGSLANCSHTYGSLFQCSAPDLDLCRLPFPGSGVSQVLPGLNNGRLWWDTRGRRREKLECFLVHLSASDGIFSSDCNSSMAPAPIGFTCCCFRFFGIFSLYLSSLAVATASFLSLTYGLPPTTSSVPHLWNSFPALKLPEVIYFFLIRSSLS